MTRFSSLHHRRSIRGIFTAIAILVVVLFVGLTLAMMSFFRVFGMADEEIIDALDREGDAVIARLERHAERTAALGLSLSQQVSSKLSDFLNLKGIAMEDLNDRLDLITELEDSVFATLRTAMYVAECSGAFMALDVTSDTHREPPSRAAVLLKFPNIFSIHTTVSTNISLVRGSSSLAVMHSDVSLHNSWGVEIEPGYFTELDSMVFARDPVHELPRGSFMLTHVAASRTTKGVGRLFIFPVNYHGRVVGACGFEIDGTIFRLVNRVADPSGLRTHFALFSTHGGKFVGQMTDSTSSARIHGGVDEFEVTRGDPFSIVVTNGERYVAQLRDITLGRSHHTAAFMIPEEVYDLHTKRWEMRTTAFFATVFAVVVIIVIVVRWIVLRYILSGIAELRDSTGGLHRLKEIDDVRKSMERMISRSTEDPLTGAGNRARLRDAFDVMLSEHEHAWTLVLTDLDDFRSINAKYGHTVGDEYIKAFASELFTAPSCEIFRYGGDEFCMLFKGKNERAVRTVCQKIFARFEESEIVARYSSTAVSYGAAVWDGEESPSQLLVRASEDLRRAKEEKK